MKSYIQGLITGIILVASAVLFMSATDNPSDVGRFQVVDVAYQYITMHGSTSQNSVFKIDTKTGQTWKYISAQDVEAWWSPIK